MAATTRRGDRRDRITEAAIEIIATRGVRAMTHTALDARLGLAKGSTSYYFRSRRALLESVVRRITERSRADFAGSGLGATGETTPDGAARAVARWLDQLLAHRSAHVVARYALAVELAGDPELHGELAVSLFSRARAVQLCTALGVPDAQAAGADFVGLVEGLVFDRVAAAGSLDGVEPGTAASVAAFARALRTYLRGAVTGGPETR